MDFQHLLAYGYAPGNYMGTCRTCNVLQHDLDKRALRCRPCAQAAYDADQSKPPPPKYTLRECPFCGHQPEEDNLYDSVHRVNREGTLWTAGCVDNEGGCNASVLAGSREEAIARWNTRVGDARTLGDVLATLPFSEENVPELKAEPLPGGGLPSLSLDLSRRIMILCPTCGNKRCPRASNALFKCTNSNAVGQVGELDAQPSGD